MHDDDKLAAKLEESVSDSLRKLGHPEKEIQKTRKANRIYFSKLIKGKK